MDNFIGKQDRGGGVISFDAYWVVHGTPQGQEANIARDDPIEYTEYANFHKSNGPIQPWPSVPGEKFIKEKLQHGIAYTFLRTGDTPSNK